MHDWRTKLTYIAYQIEIHSCIQLRAVYVLVGDKHVQFLIISNIGKRIVYSITQAVCIMHNDNRFPCNT